MDSFSVHVIPHQEARPWLLQKHYARRMPCIEYCYGIFDGELCRGVCTFGSSANRNTKDMIDGFHTIELNRLCVDALPENGLSWFVAQCLRLLPRPLVVVSYADPNNGHHGYIYQATNWIYTGQGTRKNGRTDTGITAFIKDGKEYHAKSVAELIGSCSAENAEKHGFKRTFLQPKHRYFQFLGNKKQRKQMLDALPYPVLPYPKGDNKRYDDSAMIERQEVLPLC